MQKQNNRLRNFTKVVIINMVVLSILLLIAEFSGRIILKHVSIDFLRYINADLRVHLLPDMKDVFPQLTFSRIYKPEPDLAWTLIPNSKVRRKNEDGEKWTSITSKDGFITPDTPDLLDQQIITIGDSFLEGKRNPVPIPQVIDDHTSLPVYNLAAGGWGPYSYVAAFNKHATNRNAGVVIVYSVFNDIKDATKYKLWKSEFGHMTYEDFLNADRWRYSSDNRGSTWLDRSSVVYNAIKYGITKLEQREKRPKRIQESLQLNLNTRATLYFRNELEFISCKPEEYFEGGGCFSTFVDYFHAMDMLKSAIEGSGKKMVLIWIPSKERVYFDFLDNEYQEKYLERDEKMIFDVEQVINWYAKRRDIPFLDLTPVMQKHAKSGETLYFTYDNHLNKNGSTLAGVSTVEFLEGSSLIKNKESNPSH